ncbi:MAG: lysoplasmalogenase [Bacteroidales bacterium]|nr:lysoplasmalogenase [Bacteroidales bacterium]
MKKNTSLMMHLLFAVIVLVELLGRLLDNIQMEYFVKPLIMIWMAVYFLLYMRKSALSIPVLLAFFFSWAGDNFLMLSGKNELFFFAGVGGFFLAQLSYIYTFARYSETGGKGLLQRRPWLSVFFMAYVAGMLVLLFPGLEGMMKPVIAIYAISLMLMSMTALNRSGRVGDSSFKLVFAGSLLFLLSDSLIAFNKFHSEIPLAGFLIMLSYIAAQYLIMRGLILEE